ncbi:3-oxoacyl-[acyl-carrier-protein] synthase [Clonorchis sinensis]|uniref:3-oxoacyl-[acyl-carrier-protein] synthase n=1 Tax=Clonorchis sinensis TaxID=79923 RepID=A0A3R7H3D3_CLOSI|nr:3-oxoacyl-[acyl-carrier-protein] synthase [Clonorchis sinensis]
MIRWIFHLVTLFVLEYFQEGSALSATQLQAFCSTPNTASIVGGSHRRLVTEGGRITLTCCMPGSSSGHDHEQLTWFDPRGRELTNHFANPLHKNEHATYSIPDFRSPNHLVTMLVIQRFELTDTGGYTCRKGNIESTVIPAVVMLDQRPRLLADYNPLPPSNPEDSGAAVVAGRPVFVALEEGRQGEITCRINQNNPVGEVHLTWYFQGRQLIAPALALNGKELGQTQLSYTEPSLNDMFNPQYSSVNGDLARVAKTTEFLQPSRRYDMLHGRPVSVDPAELGIRILDNGQILQMDRVDSRHSGIYLCKAEAPNPTWSMETSIQDPPSSESGAIESPVLVQLQAIRGIVFTPPRMLPGSPKEVPVPQTHDQQQYAFKKRAVRSETGHSTFTETPRFYMQSRANSFGKPQQISGTQFGKVRPVTLEGGQLVLECQARGKPSPQLLWYRGGMGTNILTDSKAFTFDQRIREALQHLTLEEVQPQLGIMIAQGDRLLPSIAGPGMEKYSTRNPMLSPMPGDMNTGQLKQNQLDRFELAVNVRKDDTGDPVITVSRLTIHELRPSDATRYTCLAVLDLSHFGGSGNYTDVGSVFPDVVLRPRFIKSGTQLQANGFPGQNATLACEAFGGLSNPQGLRLRLLRGNAVPELINLLTGSKQIKQDRSSEGYATDMAPGLPKPGAESTDSVRFRPGPTAQRDSLFRNADIPGGAYMPKHDYTAMFGNDSLELVLPGIDPRYHLSLTPDPRNPYMSSLRLHVYDLRPEDNAFYACEALSGPHWRAIAPTAHEGPGRLTVWFPPTDVEPRNVLTMTDADDLPQEKNKGLVYGLSHQPSKLSCQATGQPPPEWVWTGPETGPDVSLGNPDGPKGYQKVDYQDGELSVSELTIAAGYWNIGLFGTYTCTATNRLGSGMAHLRLKMATHPSRPALRACKVEAKMIELCVEPPKDTGGLPLTHYELRIQTHPRGAFYGPFAYLPGRRLLRLPHLIPGYYYRFALSAVSPAGRGPNTYLEVTTNRLSTPAIKMLTAQEYIEPTAYNVHWELPGNNGQEIDQYKINVRPVEVDYSMGEITGKPIGDWVEYTPVNPTCTKENEEMGTKPICQYRVDKLQPDKAYELELAGQNSAGFSEAQRVIFRTSSTSGTNGRMLNIPSYLRHTSGNTASVPSQTLHTMISMSLISYSLLYRLTSPSSSID